MNVLPEAAYGSSPSVIGNSTAALLLLSSVLSVPRLTKNDDRRNLQKRAREYSDSNYEEIANYYNSIGWENQSFEALAAAAFAGENGGGGPGKRKPTTTKRPRRTTTSTNKKTSRRTTEPSYSTTTEEESNGSSDLTPVDVTWILICSFIIFTMQTGFGLLEGGIVSSKNETNILMKNVADVVLGGFSYWIFGYGITFGTWSGSTPVFGLGYYAVDEDIEKMGDLFTSFFFQLSFATTATTIVSGALAERCNFKAYCLYSLLATFTYSVSARWVWGPTGFLKELGAIDIAGSGTVHLVGGSAAFVAAWMLGPRLGRYDVGAGPPPVGNNTSVLLGLFNLWWGWLAFNSGSTFGMTKDKWKFAARAATSTIIASIGGGLVGLIWGYAKPGKNTIAALDFVNPILGSLVGVTAGCALYHTPEAFITGVIGAIVVSLAAYLPDLVKVDDPVGATVVHGFGGIWGLLAVGIFAEDDEGILGVSQGRSGLLRGGDFSLLGIEALVAICIIAWSMFSTFFILWIINLIIPLRVGPEEELMGLDFCEHGVRRTKIGASPALSLFGSQPEVQAIHKNITGVTGQNNPGHDIITETLRDVRLSHRKRNKSGKRPTLKGAALFARAFQKIKSKGNRITPRERQYIFDEYSSVLKSSTESIKPVKQTPDMTPGRRSRLSRMKTYFKRRFSHEDQAKQNLIVNKSKSESPKDGKMNIYNEPKFAPALTNSEGKKNQFSEADGIPIYGYLR